MFIHFKLGYKFFQNFFYVRNVILGVTDVCLLPLTKAHCTVALRHREVCPSCKSCESGDMRALLRTEHRAENVKPSAKI